MAENASFQGVVCRSDFWHLKRKPALIFSKRLFFKILWGFHWITSSGKMQVKNKINFVTFSLMKNNAIDCIFWIKTEYTKRDLNFFKLMQIWILHTKTAEWMPCDLVTFLHRVAAQPRTCRTMQLGWKSSEITSQGTD